MNESMTHPAPSLTATLYTKNIHADYFHELNLRGYYHDGQPWAVVEVGGVALTAARDDGLAGMQRLADALTAAIAQARQAEQDATLAAVSA